MSIMKTTFNENVMTVEGALKAGLEFDLADDLDELVAKYPDNAICDLTRVPFMNAASLGILLACAKNHKITFRIKRGSDVEHLLDISRLLEVFTIEWVEK